MHTLPALSASYRGLCVTKSYIFAEQVGEPFGSVLVYPHCHSHLYFLRLTLFLINLPLQPALINFGSNNTNEK